MAEWIIRVVRTTEETQMRELAAVIVCVLGMCSFVRTASAEDRVVALWSAELGAPLKSGVPTMTITDADGKQVTFGKAEEAISAALGRESPVPIKIYLVIQMLKNLDAWGDAELYYGFSTTVSSGGDTLKTDVGQSSDPNNRAGKEILVGEVFSGQVAKGDEKVCCKVAIMEDDGFGTSKTEKATEFMKQLEAFSALENPGVGASIVKYTPLLPVLYSLASMILPGEKFEPTPITLLKGRNFMPTAYDLAMRGDAFQIAFVVVVGNFTFIREDTEEVMKRMLPRTDSRNGG
jgi:hypothetical protein